MGYIVLIKYAGKAVKYAPVIKKTYGFIKNKIGRLI